MGCFDHPEHQRIVLMSFAWEAPLTFFLVKCKIASLCCPFTLIYTNCIKRDAVCSAACIFQTRGQERNPLKSPCDDEKHSLLFFEWARGCCCFWELSIGTGWWVKRQKKKKSVMCRGRQSRERASHVPLWARHGPLWYGTLEWREQTAPRSLQKQNKMLLMRCMKHFFPLRVICIKKN